MVRLPFGRLPLAAALPPLALLVLLMPKAGHAYEPTAEHKPSRAGLRWVADDQPTPPPARAVAEPVTAAPEFPDATAEAAQTVRQAGRSDGDTPTPQPPTPSRPRSPVSSSLVWIAEDEPAPVVASDPQPGPQPEAQSQTAQTHPTEPLPPAVPIAPMASRSTRPGLVWVPDAEPTPLVAADPEPEPQRTLTAQTHPTEELPPVVPIASGLRWQVDDDFSALVAANPEVSPEALLAAAAPRIITVEMVVEQLESVSRHPTFGPQDLATRLMDISTAPSSGSVNHRDDFLDFSSGQVSSGQIPGAVIMPSREVAAARGMSAKFDVPVHTNNIIASSLGAGHASHTTSLHPLPIPLDRPQAETHEPFSLQPLLLSDRVQSDARAQGPLLNGLIAGRPERVKLDTSPLRRGSSRAIGRAVTIGIGLQLLSW